VLSAETGEERLRLDLPEPWAARHGGSAAFRDPYASPISVAGERIMVPCAEQVVCFDVSGRELWTRSVGASVRSSPAYDNVRGVLAVLSIDGTCRLLDGVSGQERARIRLDGKVTASPAISGGILAAATQNGSTYGIDIEEGLIVWERRNSGVRDHTSFTVVETGDFIATNERGNVVSLGREDGRQHWETSQILGLAEQSTELDVTPTPGSDGSMYCASYSGWLYHFGFQREHLWEIECP